MSPISQFDQATVPSHQAVAENVFSRAKAYPAVPALQKEGREKRTALQSIPIAPDVIQAKKTTPFFLEKNYPGRMGINYGDYKNMDDEEYQGFIFKKLETAYNRNLDRGTRYWNNLNNTIDHYNADDNKGFLKTQKKQHSDYDKKFKKNYINKLERVPDSEDIEVSSTGLAKKGDKGYVGKATPYSNSVNFEDNSITASHNYATQDRARQKDEENKGKKRYKPRGLPNSEILWQQYKTGAKEQSKIHKESKAEDLIKGLSTVKRRQVQNPSTLQTILFALPDGKDDFKAAHAWRAAGEEFKAMLGTPNCSGAAFLLADHVDELEGKSITEIELLGDDQDVNLDIKIGK